MKFLLTAINAKYIHSNPAVYSLRAFAGKALEKHIEIAEYTINQRMGDILEDIYEKKPNVVGFSCYIWNWRIIKELIVQLYKVMPGVPVWLGGPEVSYDADRILRELPMLSGIMIGEGEETFLELLRYYLDDLDNLGQVRGIVYRDGSSISVNPERNLTDMDRLPFIYKDTEQFENRIIYYESCRGCPYRCSYCLSAIDKAVRLRKIEMVENELDFFISRRVAQVKFVDRTFNCNHEHAVRVWKFIQERDNGVTNFHFEIAGDILSEEELELLGKMRPGLVQLEIGVQSGNPDTLAEINRRTDMGRLKANVERIRRQRNVHIHLDLIAGLPLEGFDSFSQSFDEVYAMNPDQLQLGFLKVLKGSPIYQDAEKYGIGWMENPPYEVLFTKWISYKEICILKRIEEMVEIYFNSGQFKHTLSILVKAFRSPFEMFGKLADYYKREGYLTLSPSRMYRYNILLEFAFIYDEVKADLYKELLTLDIYLREKIKSRPDFAKELNTHEKMRKAFYNSEHMIAKYLPGYSSWQSGQTARMTHLEFFDYNVLAGETAEKCMRRERPLAVVFDYREKEPLTNMALTQVIFESAELK